MFADEDRLDGENYLMWAYMMQHVIVSKGIWNIVQGIDVHPGSADIGDVEDVAGLATRIVVVRCGGSCIDCVVYEAHYYSPHLLAKFANQAWDILAGLYARRNEAKIAFLRKELESKIMNEDDDMDTFVVGVKDINEQFFFAGEIISNSFLVQTALDALPNSYQTFASTWRLMNQRNPKVVKFDEVCTLLLQEALSKKNRSRQRAIEQAFIDAQRKGGNSNAATSHNSSASGKSHVPNTFAGSILSNHLIK
ncbi:hypothetical protein L7F22_063849 [Adiantum nelumboides]|nr:hypothetical protein [Adiantum nelumboides]